MKQLLTFTFLLICLTTIGFGQTIDQTDTLSPKDYKDIFQLAIDLPELQKYYHIDTDTSRQQIILKFFGNVDQNKLKGLKKFGRQVLILTEDEIKQKQIKSYFVVIYSISGTDSIRLQLKYPIEGLAVSYIFKKTNNNWAIANFNLVER
jgi:hypothetical protein